MEIRRRNHYVPVWYQKGFLLPNQEKLCRLDLAPSGKNLPDGRVITFNNLHWKTPSQIFYIKDLYTTFFGPYINDEVERYLFGEIDDIGSVSVKAFISDKISQMQHFNDFFNYLDAQKIRTPKGLDWIKTKYSTLTQSQLMEEMQHIRQMHLTTWYEAVREIVSAEKSETKFIVTDNPVTIYNSGCELDSKYYQYPNDPDIAFKGSHTVFPLDMNHCLILTNLEYAKNPSIQDLLTDRTNARQFANTIAKTDTMIREREISEEEVIKINYILKKGATKYIAASKKEWLFPEKEVSENWSKVGNVLLPPQEELYQFGGNLYIGHKDGTTSFRDSYGRSTKERSYLEKPKRDGKVKPNDLCICGSGRKYKHCCKDKSPEDMPVTNVFSIRERNLWFFEIIKDILGLNNNRKTWIDIKRDFNSEQVAKIYEAFEFLWPKDTNILEMLPSPDKRILRALYTGQIDPRTVDRSIISNLPYFDEILVMNPFMNPANMRPEYNPIKEPSMYMQDTLKNLLFFLYVIPYVELGVVNLIPDPCCFNLYLKEQIFKIAKKRYQNLDVAPNDTNEMEKLSLDDFERGMLSMPREFLKVNFKKQLPDLSEEDLNQLLDFVEKKRLADPLAVLPSKKTNKYNQFHINHMMPNFELGLLLAQTTGSIIITDNKIRWKEITKQSEPSNKEFLWEHLVSNIKRLQFSYSANNDINFIVRNDGHLGLFRKTFRSITETILLNNNTNSVEKLNKSLSEEIKTVHEKSMKDLDRLYKSISKNNEYDNGQFFKGDMSLFIPHGGFYKREVHRLLLSHSRKKYLDNVLMAIFINKS